jgi:AraC family transcriptional activator of pobA
MQFFHFNIDCLPNFDKAQTASSFKFVWIREGSGSLSIDMNRYNISPNCMYFIKPGQTHAMQGEYEGHIISFTGSFLGMDDEKFDVGYADGLLRFFSRQVCFLQADTLADIKETVEKMVQEHRNIHMFRAEILKRYFKILLIYLTRQFEESTDKIVQTRDIEVARGFMRLLEKEFLLKKMVSEYADKLFLTPNYLNQIIKKLTGHSAGYHIRQRIVLEAKREAIYSDKSMKEIAYTLGFADVCHFSKFFKKLTGVNFVAFRKNKSAIPFIPEV